jgi:hypothetical protein
MMTTLEAVKNDCFQTVMAADELCCEVPASADLYGWLVGSWELDVRRYGVDVSALHIKGEAHFGRVLEGKAVQDVWIMPRRAERSGELPKGLNMFGTTLRVYDPSIQAWRVIWIDPVTMRRDELVGRKVGQDIVQVGTHCDGTPVRWIFSQITPNSFRWTGEALDADGKTWKLEGEFLAKRVQ